MIGSGGQRGIRRRGLQWVVLAAALAAFLLAGLHKLHQGEELASIDTSGYFENARHVRACGGPLGALVGCITGAYRTSNQMPLYVFMLSFLPDEKLEVLGWGKLMTLALGLMGIVAIFWAVRRELGASAAIMTAALIAVNSAYLNLSTLIACEVLLALWVTLCWLAMARYIKSGLGAAWIGAFLGLACMTKMTGILVAPAAVASVLVRRGARGLISRDLWVAAGVALLICSPIVVRNIRGASETKASAPLFAPLWVDSPADTFSPDPRRRAPSFADYWRTHSLPDMIGRFVRGVIQESKFLIVASGETYLLKERFGLKVWPVGVLILAACALALASKSCRHAAVPAIAILAVFILFFSWYIFDHIRFIFPVVPVVLALSSRGIVSVLRLGKNFGKKLIIAAALLLTCATAIFAAAHRETWKNPLKSYSLPPGYNEVLEWVEATSSEESPCMMGPSHVYSYFWTSRLDGKTTPVVSAGSLEELMGYLRTRQIRRVVIDYSTLASYTRAFGGWVELDGGGLALKRIPAGWRLVLAFGSPPAVMAFEDTSSIEPN